MSIRPVKFSKLAQPTMEGAGVNLHRVFGFGDTKSFDPFLMMDDFRNEDPSKYMKGFPWHPHRGIETITYILKGSVEHKDSLGNSGELSDGDLQWMTAGSGILHQEMPKGNNLGQMHGFQLWANLPSSLKMTSPNYQDVKSSEIRVIKDDDGTIISPVFDEISLETYSQIKNSDNFTFLDPQGFLREKNSNNEVSLRNTTLDLTNVNAIKMNPDELFALTGLTGHDGIKQLQKLGIEYVIYTNKKEISLLVKDKLYTIFLPKMTLTDTTGIGDIFCSTFTCTMLKEKDFLWALSFAGGAAQSALESKAFGLEKVPEKNALESNGSYFYNIVEFKQI